MTAFIQAHYLWLLVYLAAVNLLAFSLFGIDKSRARRHAWRIPEATLFLFVLLFGALGGWLGMRLFHHKTLHPLFKWGVPAVLIGQLVLLGYIFYAV